MSMKVFLEVEIKAGSEDEAPAILRETLAQTDAFTGNESLEVVIDDADPRKMIVIETWAATADHDAYLAWRATPEGATKLGSILAGPPVTRTFEKTLPLGS